uniref:Secreted protein n=1 Tax=Parastrongyloides trichosuri TaxID=131310 RepID=A0A0N4ZIC5_PARTI
MVAMLINLKTIIVFSSIILITRCQFFFSPYATRYLGRSAVISPPIMSLPVIQATVPGYNGRTPFVNNGAGYLTQSAALVNNHDVVISPTRVISAPSPIVASPRFINPSYRPCGFGGIC